MPEVGEKSRGLAKERLLVFLHPAAGLIPRQQERKHLPDNACGGVVNLTPGFAVSFVFPLPDRSELIDNRWQVSPLPASLRPGVICKLHEDRDASVNVTVRVLVLSEPDDILLDRLAKLRGTDAVNGVGTDEIVLQHVQPPFFRVVP